MLVRCCVQIEALSKELYFDNGGKKKRGNSKIFFDGDCLKLIDEKWKTHNKEVLVVAPFFNFTKDENRILKPLKDAHKTNKTYWKKAYQAVKHDRYSSLQQGNVKAFIRALAALYLLNIYYRNDSWITKYNDISNHDYRMGSAIFSVRSPKVDQLWYGNKPILSESPYVVTYDEKSYQLIETILQKEDQSLNAYFWKQPEILDQNFIVPLLKAIEREKNDPQQTVIPIFELVKFRLKKKFPSSLPFEERKKLLINSSEWQLFIRISNNNPNILELTEDNIQKNIDLIEKYIGAQIICKFKKNEWLSIAFDKKICNVYIPQ